MRFFVAQFFTSSTMATAIWDFFTADQLASSTTREISSIPIFTEFDDTWCRNPTDTSYTLLELNALVTIQQTEDICLDYCLQVNCDSYHTMYQWNPVTSTPELRCVFSVFDSDSYLVTESMGWKCNVRGPTVDCRSTSNCNSQISTCGGALSYFGFEKADLLACIASAQRFEFESQNFSRKTHTTNDFFYNEFDKTFMNG